MRLLGRYSQGLPELWYSIEREGTYLDCSSSLYLSLTAIYIFMGKIKTIEKRDEADKRKSEVPVDRKKHISH